MLHFPRPRVGVASLAALTLLTVAPPASAQRPERRPPSSERRLLVDRAFDATPLRTALLELAQDHDVSIVFGVTPGMEPVTAHFSRTSAFDAAQALLVAAGYRFEVRAGNILVIRGAPPRAADPAGAADPELEPSEELPSPPQASRSSVKPGINENFLDPELDVDRFVERFEGESREVFAHRARLAAVLDLKPGMAVADIGAGTGLFMDLFANRVGEEGRVYAVDLSPRFVDHLRDRAAERDYEQVEVVRCTEDSAELPADSVDRVFICDTYHHFEYPAQTMASIRRALRPGGELVVVDFDRIPGVSREWLLGHVRAGRDEVCAELAGFGFEFVEFVPVRGLRENYVVRFRVPAE